jgi:ATP-dependent DNA ligase
VNLPLRWKVVFDVYHKFAISELEFCLPTNPTPSRIAHHEIKYDGFRMLVEHDGDRVRLITRGGYNWSDRYP